ncbi:MAG: polyphosphate kinase 1 [Flavobacteriales bacterium]|jgi:polyphosphate kinase|nr:polyphosphate kinase 1 [Flavobacteriales bacterium]
MHSQFPFNDREKSWLAFNERVLQEAADPTVPLLDRYRFLGIFSNNLDEFFRVRFANIRRLSVSEKSKNVLLGGLTPKQLLKDITKIVIQQQTKSLQILDKIESELKKHQIFLVNEQELSQEHQIFVKDYFIQQVSPALVTIILNDLVEFPHLKDTSGYLAIKLVMKDEVETKSFFGFTKKNKEVKYAIIEIPTSINRFVELPSENSNQYVMMLDDVIRYNLGTIFTMFDFENISAYMLKITRDAQLDLDSDLRKSLAEKISQSVKHRNQGEIVRFVYDDKMDKDMLGFLLEKMNIDQSDSVIPGGRYHNRRDYMNFPNLGRKDLLYQRLFPLPVKGLSLEGSIFQKLKQKDYLVHTPYQSFAYVIKLLREAALDPKVVSIKITLYRLANNSQIVSSLINAAKNGKKVTVQIELQARFDEASNIMYSKQMQAEGIELIFGVKGLKVHSKVCLIERLESGKIKRYGFISTGNFNESTAKIYTDVTLLTSNQALLKDVSKVFNFFDVNYKIYRYKHLIVSPHYLRNKIYKLIDREIQASKQGKKSYIKLKMNSLTDPDMIVKLYEASQAGVEIKLIVRGMCCLVPGIKGYSESIEAISIVDNLLEHTRVFIFSNQNNPEVYISSADFMSRNIDDRVEVTCPIYDNDIKQELIETFEIGWKGNVKARLHSAKLDNLYRKKSDHEPIHRAQLETYQYYQKIIQS